MMKMIQKRLTVCSISHITFLYVKISKNTIHKLKSCKFKQVSIILSYGKAVKWSRKIMYVTSTRIIVPILCYNTVILRVCNDNVVRCRMIRLYFDIPS